MPSCSTCIYNNSWAMSIKCKNCGADNRNYEPKRRNIIMTGMRHGKTFTQEEFMTHMTRGDMMKSVFRTQREADEALAQKYGKRKDYNKMNEFKNIVVYIDGEYYRPCGGEFKMDPLEYNLYRLEVSKQPRYKIKEAPGKSHLIKDVIFNPPATIVFWIDGSKTVVKAQNDEPFDPEKGLAMAIAKKSLGNQGNYFETIKKWTKPYYEVEEKILEWAKSVVYGEKAKSDDECQTK